MSDKKVNIGFVGVGGMGQCAHLKNYASIPECNVTAIAEIREDLRLAVAARYGIPRTYATHTEMLAKEQLDGIVASQPFDRHGVLIPELFRAKIPVFTEKPLAASIAMGEIILGALADSGTWQMIGYHKRSDPATMAAKAEIDRLKASGELGALQYVRILMPAGDWIAGGFFDLLTSSKNPAGMDLTRDPPPSDMDAETYNRYTAFVNYYIHQVNLMRHLLGEPYKATYAEPSGVLMAGQSESGIACVIEMSPYRTSVDWQESALVCFEKGWIKLELPAPLALMRPGRVTFFRDPADGKAPVTLEPQMPWVHAMRQQAVNFIEAIKGRTKPMCDAAEALEDLKVARDYIRLRFGN